MSFLSALGSLFLPEIKTRWDVDYIKAFSTLQYKLDNCGLELLSVRASAIMLTMVDKRVDGWHTRLVPKGTRPKSSTRMANVNLCSLSAYTRSDETAVRLYD